MRLKVRSIVGLLPVCAVTVIEPAEREQLPKLVRTFAERLRRMPDLLDTIHATGPGHFGVGERGIMGLVNQDRLRRILSRMLDEDEFLSPYGIRALSRHHAEHPFVFVAQGQEYRVNYLPAESDTGMFGGNSNWRGPIWMPVNALLICALLQYYLYYGDTFKVECPTGSGNLMNLFEVSREIANRLSRIFLRDQSGRRPVYGGVEKFQNDPHWRDYLLFYEYFHGDNGAGIGASHQTGWTGVVAKLIEIFGRVDPQALLKVGAAEAFAPAKEAKPAGRLSRGEGSEVAKEAASNRDVRDGIASMTIAPRYPSLYQLNTRVWLRRLSRDRRKRATLAEIDDATIDGFARQGFDCIWLLSVWRTGPAGRAISRSRPEWRAEFGEVLPDLEEDGICGSGFAITAYTVSDPARMAAILRPFPRLGAQVGLAACELILDRMADAEAQEAGGPQNAGRRGAQTAGATSAWRIGPLVDGLSVVGWMMGAGLAARFMSGCVSSEGWMSSRRKAAGAKIRGPVVWIAGWRETKTLKPIDNVSHGEATSYRAVTTVNAKVASKMSSPEGRAPNRRAKAAWGAEI